MLVMFMFLFVTSFFYVLSRDLIRLWCSCICPEKGRWTQTNEPRDLQFMYA